MRRSSSRSGPTGRPRSFNESVFMRPTESVDLNTTYFLPNTLGGDHSFKAGYRMRWARGESISHYGGNAVARFDDGVAAEADVYRDGWTASGMVAVVGGGQQPAEARRRSGAGSSRRRRVASWPSCAAWRTRARSSSRAAPAATTS